MSGWTTGQDPVELQELLQGVGVDAHQVQHTHECLADPQLAHRNQFRRVAHAVHGEVLVEGPNVTFSRTPPAPAHGGPTLGLHTEWVLKEILGYDDDRITDLVIAEALR